MFKLSQLAKEEITKNVIDKLVFGLLASIILFGMQKCAENHDREQLQKQAILQIESHFIMDGASVIKNDFSLYLLEVSKFISGGVPLYNDQKVDLINQGIKLESEIEAISAFNLSLKEDGKILVGAVKSLNDKINLFSDGSTEIYSLELDTVKIKYQQFISALKKAAILSLSEK